MTFLRSPVLAIFAIVMISSDANILAWPAAVRAATWLDP